MDILLSTLNARYIHSSLALRYLQANLGSLRDRSKIIEYTINQDPELVASDLLSHQPKIIGLGVYVWNVTQTLKLIRLLRARCPSVKIILGGPEVSHETEMQEIVSAADFTIRGEADSLFRQTCERLLSSDTQVLATLPRIIDGPQPDLSTLQFPYRLYTDEDIKNRVIYVEASRGCAFKCEYCLSSLDIKVRSFDLSHFLNEMSELIDRGARQFKFIDRTFNLSIKTSTRILEFFLDKMELGLFLHFEMVPDRLPDDLKRLIVRFPPGSLQFEVGIQTWNTEVSALVSRRQDTAKIEENLTFLRQETGVHIHADLIAGLPGESIQSFAAGFDRLFRLRPHEIQLGILKRLRGTPIIRHDNEWGMHYSPSPPYEILRTNHMTADELLELRRISKVWDLVSNRGYFKSALALLDWTHPFEEIQRFTHFLWTKTGRTHSIDLMELSEELFRFAVTHRGIEPEVMARALISDLRIPAVRPIPPFLKPYGEPAPHESLLRLNPSLPARQQRFYR